jgi:predicted metal-dependent phosphoesterase TrpH
MDEIDVHGKGNAGVEQLDNLTVEEAQEVESLGAAIAEDEKHQPGTMKIDLHCHSEASHDCSTPLELIPGRCIDRDLSVLAITDHDQIWGALKLKEMVDSRQQSEWHRLTIIAGQEISTSEGEIIGLFLKEAIPPGLSPEKTVEKIKDQGGLVLLPHGFDPLKRWRLKPEALERIAGSVDIVETFNSRISRIQWNQAAVSWSKERELLMSAGSDAHTLSDIGSAWVEVPMQAIEGPQDLIEALKDGTPVGEWTHPVAAYLYKVWDRTLRKLELRQ